MASNLAAKQAQGLLRRSAFLRPSDAKLRDVRQTLALAQQVVADDDRRYKEIAEDTLEKPPTERWPGRRFRGLIHMHFPRDPETGYLFGFGSVTFASTPSTPIPTAGRFLKVRIPSREETLQTQDGAPIQEEGGDLQFSNTKAIIRGNRAIRPRSFTRWADLETILGLNGTETNNPREEVELKIGTRQGPFLTRPPKGIKKHGTSFEGFSRKEGVV